MPAKHSVHTFGAARAVLSAAVALLVLVVVWVAVRAVGPTTAAPQPALVVPSPSLSSPVPTRPTARAAPRRTAPSPVPSKTRAKPSRTASPPPRSKSAPPPRATAAATLRIFAAWNAGYAAGGRVTNTGSAPLTWRVTVTHAGTVRPDGVHGATVTRDGTTLVFRGGPLPPGATAEFGFQATSRGRTEVRPTGCSVVGGACGMG